MKSATELRSDQAKLLKEARTLYETAEKDNDGEGRDLTEDEEKRYGECCDQAEVLKRRIDRAEQVTAFDACPGRSTDPPDPVEQPGGDLRPQTRLAAVPKHHRALRTFTRERFGDDAEGLAYRAGLYLASIWPGEQWAGVRAQAHERARAIGFELRGHIEGANPSGGFYVPDMLDTATIILREQYGVFRRTARPVTMTSETSSRNRVIGGLTVVVTGESEEGTTSTTVTDRVNLVAQKRMVVTTISSELNEDAFIDMGDFTFGEMAHALALHEDECGFNGDGSSTFGGIVGARAKIKGLSGTIANIAGLVVSANNTYAEITLPELNAVTALLPVYADQQSPAWFVHKTFWSSVMVRLELAAGGNTRTDIQASGGGSFLGYPVIFSQVMPKVEGNSQVCALLASLPLAADFGDRRGMTVSLSEHATVDSKSVFLSDELAVKATERFDINVHDVGNATATAADKLPGPLVGLILAAS